MKKNDWLLLLSTAAYSFLFYKQALGVNFFIFSFLLVAFLLIRNTQLIKSPAWCLVAAGTIFSGWGIFMYGTLLTFCSNFVSLSILAAISINTKSSVLFSLIYSLFSYLTSIGFMVVDFIARKQKKLNGLKINFGSKILIYVGIFIVILVFFLLYRQSNALFKDFTKYINFDFISWTWVFFTLIGFILLYGFFYPKNIEPMVQYDINTPENLNKENILSKVNKIFGKETRVETENYAGTILFVLLNVMLFLVNVLDLVYIWAGKGLPEEVTYSDFLRQGVGAIILSIFIAITIILFFFRSHLNFFEKNKAIKILVLFWIIQNAFMIVSTILRNNMYIAEYSLTYKRIGVYVWLAVCLSGLAITFMKVMYRKTNWFLITKNGWALYFTFIFLSLFNWDLIIANTNIKNSRTLDKYYLLDLNASVLPKVLDMKIDTVLQNEEEANTTYRYYYKSNSMFNYNFQNSFTANVHNKMYNFLKYRKEADWQSYCYSKNKAINEILEMHNAGKIKALYLTNNNISSLEPIADFVNIEELDLRNNYVNVLNELKSFKKLKKLNLSSNNIYNFGDLPVLPQLEELNIDKNYPTNLSNINENTTLKVLSINQIGLVDLSKLYKLNKLTSLDISNNNIFNYKNLNYFPLLENLYVRRVDNKIIDTIPELQYLKTLDLSDNNISIFDWELFVKFSAFKNLEKLDLSQNQISNLFVITTAVKKFDYSNKTILPFYENLKELNVANNTLDDLTAINYFNKLSVLNISNNNLKSIVLKEGVPQIINLISNSNSLADLSFISYFPNLQKLELKYNQINSLKKIDLLVNVSDLDLSYNAIVDINLLSKLTKLKTLRLRDNTIKDISVLSNLKALEVLDLRNNNIDDYSALYELKNLKVLHITEAPLKIYDELRAKLPNTKIYNKNKYNY